MTEKDLHGAFTAFGDVVDAHLRIDRHSKKPTGMAFVTFLMPKDAVKAFDSLNGTPLCGRLLRHSPRSRLPNCGQGHFASLRTKRKRL